MSEPKFTAGDLVQLISGSPTMTITNYTSNGGLVCTWFSEIAGDFKSHNFFEQALKSAPAEKSTSKIV